MGLDAACQSLSRRIITVRNICRMALVSELTKGNHSADAPPLCHAGWMKTGTGDSTGPDRSRVQLSKGHAGFFPTSESAKKFLD
jgi:hypothetical protein